MGAQATLLALADALDKSQWLTASDIAARQYAQLRVLAQHLAKHCTGFRERLTENGLTPETLATPDGLQKWPSLPRHEIQSRGESFFSAAIPKGHEPFGKASSSGSTGQKVIVRKTALTQMTWMAMTVRSHAWANRDLSGRLACVVAHVDEVKEYPDWTLPMGTAFETGPSLMIPVVFDLHEQVRLIRDFKADYLLISPSNLNGLIDACGDAPIKGLKGITTINETLQPEVRKRAEEFFGAPVDDIYSSAEIGNMAFQCPDSGLYHVMAENVLLEVVDGDGRACEPGDVGRVLATDLQNFAMPMIRYEIGDYAEAAAPCTCGRGLPAIKRVMGRARNLAVRPDGARFWPSVGMCDLHEVAPVLQFQYVQHAPDRIELRLVVSRDVTPAEEAAMRGRVHDRLRYAYHIDFVYFSERFPRAKNGKFEEFICKVAA